eukprot:Awhi_evm1s2510
MNISLTDAHNVVFEEGQEDTLARNTNAIKDRSCCKNLNHNQSQCVVWDYKCKRDAGHRLDSVSTLETIVNGLSGIFDLDNNNNRNPDEVEVDFTSKISHRPSEMLKRFHQKQGLLIFLSVGAIHAVVILPCIIVSCLLSNK